MLSSGRAVATQIADPLSHIRPCRPDSLSRQARKVDLEKTSLRQAWHTSLRPTEEDEVGQE